jgi:hypothetical protein
VRPACDARPPVAYQDLSETTINRLYASMEGRGTFRKAAAVDGGVYINHGDGCTDPYWRVYLCDVRDDCSAVRVLATAVASLSADDARARLLIYWKSWVN